MKFISFDGIDGCGKGWAVKKLGDMFRKDGLRVWAGTPRDILGSCRLVQPDQIDDFIIRKKRLMDILSESYDVIIFDRSAVTLMANWSFWRGWKTPEVLFQQLEMVFADINIVLQPDFELCCKRASDSQRPESHLVKTEDYMQSFSKTMSDTNDFLKKKLGNRYVVIENNEVAVEWVHQLYYRLQTHFDLHLTNACPLKCPTCCFAAGTGTKMCQAIDTHWYEIVDAGLSVGIKEFHLMGGEPLVLGQKLVDLMKYIKFKGGKTHVLTSGYDLTYADEILPLAEAVFVSLDGPEATHNRTRGANIFKNACEFIKKAVKYGCKIRIGTVVSRLNIETAIEVVDVVQSLNIPEELMRSIVWMNMSPTGGLFSEKNGSVPSLAALDNYLSADEWIDFVNRLKNDEKIKSLPYCKVEPAFSKQPEDFGCELLQGRRRVMVMSDGGMYACPMLTPLPASHNILSGDPKQVLIDFLSEKMEVNDPCKNGCQGGCPAYAKLFGNGLCDARCGGSEALKKFSLSREKKAEGYRPICPCRTRKVSLL